ncbi:MAG: periplasmic heavy metal sensor [Stappiaceae bacterium]
MTIRGKTAWTIVILLFISLAINSFVGGYILSRERLYRPFEERANFGVMRGLPKEIRNDIRKSFRDHRVELRANRRALHEARTELYAILRAETFDRSAYDATAGEIRKLLGEMAVVAEKIIGDTVETIPFSVRSEIKVPPLPHPDKKKKQK